MLPELKPKDLIRYLITMTIFVIVVGTSIRLATRCELGVLRSLNLKKIVTCATLYGDKAN
jgi:hypothetical protein